MARDCKHDSDKTAFGAEDRAGFEQVSTSGQPDDGNDPIGLLPLQPLCFLESPL